MRRTALLVSVLCLAALAADNEAIALEQATSHKPQATVVGHRSPVLGGADAITIPQMLSYQGRLTDTTGIPVPDGEYPMMFLLYTVPSGGSPFWSETQSVTTRDGLFSVLLGSVTPVDSVPSGGAVYLAMTVSGGPQLVPRLRIASAAFAYLSGRAANADLLQGRDTTTFSRSNHSHDATYVNEGQVDAVTSSMIVNGAVLTAEIGDTAVTMAKIAQAGATTGQVVKWTGSGWAPGQDNTGGGSGVTNVYQDTGIICVPNPITSSGNVKLDLSYGDGRYVNVTGDSLTGALVVQGDLRVYGKGRIGPSNSNAGAGAFVVGQGNSVGGAYSSLTGGEDNSVVGSHSHIGGGGENNAGGDYSFVGGGSANYATGVKSAVSGGVDNTALGVSSFVGGGSANTAGDAATDTGATVAGGHGNLATAMFAMVGGGQDDTASGSRATVGGGKGNAASISYALVGGGLYNKAGGYAAVVGGGQSNTATGEEATVGGGLSNNATGDKAAVGGGYGNDATGNQASIGGGYYNDAAGTYATVGGGYNNSADTSYATVGGGHINNASGWGSTVSGGSSNSADGEDATVGGGLGNDATGDYAAVGGGYDNNAVGYGATVAGGRSNVADTNYTTVGGGYSNTASAAHATVPGGGYNAARGSYGLAAGRYARANHRGSFVWSDSAASASESVYTTGDNQFRARARGGTWFFSNAGMTTGAYLAPGSNSWESACDSMTKEDFRQVDRMALLDKVAALRVRDYKMKDQNDGTRHIGPVAQDFHSAFGYGGNETGINLADADGVALAAIQALYEELRAVREVSAAQKAEIEALKAELKRR